MADLRIQYVAKHGMTYEGITLVGSDDWASSAAEAVRASVAHRNTYFTIDKDGARSDVTAVHGKYLRSHRNYTANDNLLSLPNFPLCSTGKVCTVAGVYRFETHGNGSLTPLPQANERDVTMTVGAIWGRISSGEGFWRLHRIERPARGGKCSQRRVPRQSHAATTCPQKSPYLPVDSWSHFTSENADSRHPSRRPALPSGSRGSRGSSIASPRARRDPARHPANVCRRSARCQGRSSDRATPRRQRPGEHDSALRSARRARRGQGRRADQRPAAGVKAGRGPCEPRPLPHG